jgi:hypothetical protein
MTAVASTPLGPVTRVALNHLDALDPAPRRVALLVAPPQATTAAAGIAMAEEPAPMSPQPLP